MPISRSAVLSSLAVTGLLISAFIVACDDEARSEPTTPETTATATTTPLPSPTSIPPSPTPTLTPGPTAIPPTPCQPSAYEIARGNPNRPVVALTFDAGSDAGYTAQVLQTLRNENVKASFGITGEWAQSHPDLLRAIVADGHLIINHSQNHRSFTGVSTRSAPLSRDERLAELQQADASIQAAAGVSTLPFFRPPYGDVDASVLCDVYAGGYTHVIMWNADTMGWRGATPQQITQTALAAARPGAIYIMHVGAQSADGIALPEIIRGLRGLGYSFGTVAEILQ